MTKYVFCGVAVLVYILGIFFGGSRRKTVLRKRPCGDGGDIADEKGKIRAAFLTESGTRGGETKAFGSGGHVAILTNR